MSVVTNKQLVKRVKQLDKLTEARNVLSTHAANLNVSTGELIRLLYALDVAEGVQQYTDEANADLALQEDDRVTAQVCWQGVAEADDAAGFLSVDELKEEVLQFCAALDATDEG